MVNSHARRPARLVDTPFNVAHAIRHAVELEDYALPLEDIEISETQRLVRVDSTFIPFADHVIREAWIAWCLDLESGNEAFMMVAQSQWEPVLRITPQAEPVRGFGR